MEWSTILGLAARHVLTSIGGYLAGMGLLGADPAAVQNFVGAGMVIVGVGWSAWMKWGHVMIEERLAKAKDIHPDAIKAP